MRTRIINNKAQNFVEYTLILGIVGVALFTMQTYFRRGVQSVIKVTADDLAMQGEPFKDQERAEEKKLVDKKAKDTYKFEHKYEYGSNSSQNVTIINDGKDYGAGKIRRETSGTTSYDDKSY